MTTTTTMTTDAGAWVYYKLTLWAWQLRWANKIAILDFISFANQTYFLGKIYQFYLYFRCEITFIWPTFLSF